MLFQFMKERSRSDAKFVTKPLKGYPSCTVSTSTNSSAIGIRFVISSGLSLMDCCYEQIQVSLSGI